MIFPPHGRLAVWYFWYFAFIGAFLPYFALYLQSIGLSAGRIAVLMSLGQFMRLLAPLLWSWLADSSGRRVRIVVASSAASLASFSAVFLTQDFVGLLLGLALLHFFWSASLPLVEALTLAHLAPNPERYGRIRLWGSVGFIVTVLGVGLLLDFAPISAQLWVSWALLLGATVSALTLTEVNGVAGQVAGQIMDVLRQRKVLFLLAAGLFMNAAHGALYVFYSIHLVAQGYGKTLVGLLWTLGVVAEIVVFLAMPRIARWISMRRILLACFILAVLRFLVIGWAVEFVVLLFIAQLLHGASFGAHHAATMAALNRWFVAGQQARAQALYGSVAYGAGGLGGALLAGILWDSAGAAITFSAASGLALIGLILVWRGVPAESAREPVR
ncbi:MFS transporter [Sulfuritalea sp.]|uniref:MFS transporter n=1 Tax=Sulfuritalea sp. TaxID=2480090 RepID=UPI0025F6D7B3|nr:MFS transporter [Sulfuritalea sp.]